MPLFVEDNSGIALQINNPASPSGDQYKMLRCNINTTSIKEVMRIEDIVISQDERSIETGD